jgi:hypothetical protein
MYARVPNERLPHRTKAVIHSIGNPGRGGNPRWTKAIILLQIPGPTQSRLQFKTPYGTVPRMSCARLTIPLSQLVTDRSGI